MIPGNVGLVTAPNLVLKVDLGKLPVVVDLMRMVLSGLFVVGDS